VEVAFVIVLVVQYWWKCGDGMVLLLVYCEEGLFINVRVDMVVVLADRSVSVPLLIMMCKFRVCSVPRVYNMWVVFSFCSQFTFYCCALLAVFQCYDSVYWC